MALLDTLAIVVHQLVAALWVGSVVYVAYAVLPLGRDGEVAPDILAELAGRLLTVSRWSALLLLASGAPLLYWNVLDGQVALEPLLGDLRGGLILAMVVLWLLLAAVVEASSARLRRGLDAGKVREPARDATTWYWTATLLAALVAVVGGLLAAGVGA